MALISERSLDLTVLSRDVFELPEGSGWNLLSEPDSERLRKSGGS